MVSGICCSSRRRHTRLQGDWSSDVCSSDLCDLPVSMITGMWPLSALRFSVRHTWKPFWRGSTTSSKITSGRSEAAFAKIGRASCRERVSDYDVGVTWKKKKRHMHIVDAVEK